MEVGVEGNLMDELKRAYKQVRIISISLIVGLFLYVIVVEIIKRQMEPFEGFSPFSNDYLLRYILFACAISIFLAIKFVKNRMLSEESRSLSSPQRKSLFSPPVQRLVSFSVISLALSETIAIYGLVIFLINGSFLDFYLFFALSFVFIIIHFPRYSQWEDWIKKIEMNR